MPGAPPSTSALPQPSAPTDLSTLLHALQQRQIPSLPGPSGQPSPVPQLTAMNLLSLMLSNPNLQRTLQNAHMTGAVPRSVELPVPMTTPPLRTRQVQIPLGAVMNALAALAGQAMTELNESTSEDEPEVPAYLVGDDGDFLVDPASADDRGALVTHLFRLSDEVDRAGYGSGSEADFGEDEAEDLEADSEYADNAAVYGEDEIEDEQDEIDSWAEAAGFM